MLSNLFISNLKLIIKRLCSICILFSIIIFCFYKFVKIVEYPRRNFYDFYNYVNKNTVDVLCVGSSHMYLGINPVQMWDDYGIAAFDLACSDQTIWFSYYYIKEALKTQSPQIVILDVYALVGGDEYYYDGGIIQTNLVNMSLSYDKWEALKAAECENKAEIFFQFPVFHSRYDELKKNDFNLNYNGNLDFLGYYYTTLVEVYDEDYLEDIGAVKDVEPISEKKEEYLRKSIELCQNENIDIVLTNTPWPDIKERHQKQYNYIQTIADEYGIPFINACLYSDEIGMDYRTDSMGQAGHLNHSGVTKYTKWLCSWLKENYDLKDRRNDIKWSEWQKQSDKLYAAICRDRLIQMENSLDIFNLIENEAGMYYVVSLNGKFDSENEENLLDILADRGFSVDRNGTYVMNAGKELFYSDGEQEYNWWHYFEDSVLNIHGKDDSHFIDWDGSGYVKVKNGINIFVYDELLNEVVDVIGFDADNNYELVR